MMIQIELTEQEVKDIAQGLRNAIGKLQKRREAPKITEENTKRVIEVEDRIGQLYNRFAKLAYDHGIQFDLDDPKIYKSIAARNLRSIPSEMRSQASRDNGKKGGRPRKVTA